MDVLKKLRAALAPAVPGGSVPLPRGTGRPGSASGRLTTKAAGDAAEDLALAHLQAAGLVLEARNYRTPGRGGGEIDLVLRAPDGTLVFVEVRRRAGAGHGGAGASIGAAKQRRIVLAARHYLLRFDSPPPCRFDAVLVEGGRIAWLQAAFDAA